MVAADWRHVLVGCVGAGLVVVGEDFHFGHQRQGNVALLRELGEELGFEVLGPLIDLLPSPLLGPVMRLGSQSTPANLAVSNLPGPRIPMYLLGARQFDMYPVLPLIGNQALGIVLMSYEDSLCWGLNADWDTVPDLHDLVERIEAGYDELSEIAATK